MDHANIHSTYEQGVRELAIVAVTSKLPSNNHTDDFERRPTTTKSYFFIQKAILRPSIGAASFLPSFLPSPQNTTHPWRLTHDPLRRGVVGAGARFVLAQLLPSKLEPKSYSSLV
jgi:hypothetical protein